MGKTVKITKVGKSHAAPALPIMHVIFHDRYCMHERCAKEDRASNFIILDDSCLEGLMLIRER